MVGGVDGHCDFSQSLIEVPVHFTAASILYSIRLFYL